MLIKIIECTGILGNIVEPNEIIDAPEREAMTVIRLNKAEIYIPETADPALVSATIPELEDPSNLEVIVNRDPAPETREPKQDKR